MLNKKLTKTEVIEKLLDMLKRAGYDNINFSQVARDTGWTRQTLTKFCESILNNITPEQISKEAAKSFFSLNGMEQHYNAIIEGSSDKKTRLAALDGKRRFEETKFKVMEAWGYKDKIAEKIEVSGTVSRMQEIYEGLREGDSE